MRNICSDDLKGSMLSIQPLITKCRVGEEETLDVDLVRDTVSR